MTFLTDLPGARATARAVAAGQRPVTDQVEAALERIERLEPELHAFLCLNPRARQEARRARSGPLAGVPFTVKDLILTRDLPTTAGSRTFGEGLRSRRDAPVVARLRRAGAVLLGKVNLHELAMGVTTVNEPFGPSRNPWQRDRVAGGSSGGSAVAVAAGFGAFSVGTDTRGSIRIPAACCGVVGLKPTFGLVDTRGVVPLAPSLDHVGPLTRNVEDAALVLGVMAGSGRRAARWLAAVDRPVSLRLGRCAWFFEDLDGEVAAVLAEAERRLAGALGPLRPVTIEGLADAHRASGVITAAEALAFHAERLAAHPEGFGASIRARLEAGASLTAVDYVRAEQSRALVTAAFREVFRQVDCLAAPTLPALPPRIGEHQVRINGRDEPVLQAFTRLTAVANLAGLPALSMPCGTTASGLPVGLQLLAAPGRDDVVLAAAAAFERAGQ